ncbi:MAG: DMT family transporter [bacterium]
MTPALVLLIGIIAVSSSSILIRLCDAPALVIAAYRLTIASFFFLATSKLKKNQLFTGITRRDSVLAMLSGFFLSIHFAAWITSLEYTSVASSVVLVSTTPVFVALGSVFFLKEKLGKILVYGITGTVLGAGILGASGTAGGPEFHSWIGNALALLGAVGMAGYLLCGRRLRSEVTTLTYVALVYSAAAVIMVLVTFLFKLNMLAFSSKTYLLLVLIAIFPQIIGHTSFNWALKFVSATVIAVVTLGEPIGASIMAFFIFGETLTAFQTIGGILILMGVALAIRGASTTPCGENS